MAYEQDGDWIYEEEVEHHLHWGSILAGALIAVVTGAMLNILGLAIGALAADPFSFSGEQAAGIGVAGGIWIAVSNMLALALGGYVAARSAPYVDRDEGMLHGLAVWAVAFLIAIVLVGGSVMGAAGAVLGGAADRAASSGVEDTARVAAGAAAPDSRAGTEDVADAAAGGAFWVFVAMLLGGAAALGGARIGSGPVNWSLHPNSRRHHDHDHRDHARSHRRDRDPEPAVGDRDRPRT